MSYTFTPLTDEEIDLASLCPEGEYDFEIIDSLDKPSKAGNPMNTIECKFWDKEGHHHTVKDWLVFVDAPLSIRKIKHFCESVGLSEDYKKGSLISEFSGLSGRFIIGIKDRENKDGLIIGKQNCVIDYIASDKKSSVDPNQLKDDFNDALPF